MLDIISRRTKLAVDEICEEYSAINRKLVERTVSIEELVAQKQFVASVPKLVQNLQRKLANLDVNYGILEEFFYNISMDDFNKKWEAFGWAQDIELQVEETLKIQERDRSRFQKELLTSMLVNMLI